MDYEPMNQSYGAGAYGQQTLGSYVAKTYLWMFAGLMLTFGIAMAGYATGAVFYVFQIPYMLFILTGVEFLTVVVMSARANKISVGAARGMFLFYSALNGVVFSAYFLLFDLSSMILVFGATALFFGIMALLGYVLKLDFSKIRPFMFGGLLFLAAFWLLSMFINLSQFELIVCAIGIFLFLGYTAYDTHKIKESYEVFSQDDTMLAKASIFSALELYLDFINLFVYLLRVLGRSKD